MKVNGKKIIVTGAGGGVGRQLALQLLKKNATVLAVDINEIALSETVKSSDNNPNLHTYRLDLSNKDDVTNFSKKVLEEFENIDGLINNAGIIQPFIGVNEIDFDRIERVMNINFYGTLYMIKAFLPNMLTRPQAHIVNVSSMGGFLPVPGQSIYGASKAAVKLMTEGMYSELRDTNVGVSVVIPGGISTDIIKNSGTKEPKFATNEKQKAKQMKKVLSPEQAASLIIKAMEKNKLRMYIGKDSKIMRKLYKYAPNFSMKMINKAMKASDH